MKAEDIWRELNGGEMSEAGVFCCALALARDLSHESIGAVCELSPEAIGRLVAKARDCGLIVGEKIECEWMDPETGGIALIIDSLVLDGLMQRV